MSDSFAQLFQGTAVPTRVMTWEWTALLVIIAFGGVLRFWGLDAHGLEYDEETMAMPVMHIVQHGSPVMPSGMTYVRGVVQLYLMAGSVSLFGPTEWALRLPSALCSVLLLLGCYFMGRRFLPPIWALAFVGVVALSATMILDAQEARMYVFMVTSLVWSVVCIFRWERSNRLIDLAAAVALLIIAIQFHSLAVFGAMPLIFPGLLHADRRRLLHGFAAFTFVVGAFAVIHQWVEGFFPPAQVEGPSPGALVIGQKRVYSGLVLQLWPVALLVIVLIGYCSWMLRRRVADAGLGWFAAACIGAGLCAQLFVLYHAAALLFAVGIVAALRGRVRITAFIPLLVLSALMFAVQIVWLHETQPMSLRKLLGMFPGVPSIWPYFIFAGYSPIAAAIVAMGLAVALYRLSRRERISDVWLFGALSIWAPLCLIGIFTWYTQQRYTEFALVPLLLCAMTTLWAASTKLTSLRTPALAIPVAISAALLLGNPFATAKVVNAGYSIHPDHKGAADYVRSVRQPHDVILAEDVLQQTYYLGRVNYWLIGERTAKKFTRVIDGRRLDIYTHTPVLTEAPQLEALIASRERGAIYIVGSGEQQQDGRRLARGPTLAPFLERARWDVVYRGRDGLTNVWRIPEPPVSAQ
ncbi:MAG: glycosyltransferase family 39 protein [Steroidobacteraceae bacterium]